MANVFFVAAIVSGGVALGGYIWSAALRLREREQDAGTVHEADRVAISQPENAEGAAEIAGSAAGGSTDQAQAGVSIAAVARQVRVKGWRPALPGLLTIGGMLMVLVSAALALLTSLPGKLFGIAALGVALTIVVSELRSFGKALRE
jgi:hypothetical protein